MGKSGPMGCTARAGTLRWGRVGAVFEAYKERSGWSIGERASALRVRLEGLVRHGKEFGFIPVGKKHCN